jgi:hypothetical protein
VSRFLVYGLIDPDTNAIRYIGLSTRGLDRPRDHVRDAGKERTYKAAWVRKLLREGKVYGIRILEEYADRQAVSVGEIRWIAEGRRLGWPLTNVTDGGDTGSVRVLALPDAEIVRDYLNGDSELALARRHGVSRQVITLRLRDAGVDKRDVPASNLIRMATTPPDIRKANALAAQNARKAACAARRLRVTAADVEARRAKRKAYAAAWAEKNSEKMRAYKRAYKARIKAALLIVDDLLAELDALE